MNNNEFPIEVHTDQELYDLYSDILEPGILIAGCCGAACSSTGRSCSSLWSDGCCGGGK